MAPLLATQKEIIQESVIKNLLSAHKRIAESGDARGVILISRYVLKLAEKYGDVVVDIGSERSE